MFLSTPSLAELIGFFSPHSSRFEALSSESLCSKQSLKGQAFTQLFQWSLHGLQDYLKLIVTEIQWPLLITSEIVFSFFQIYFFEKIFSNFSLVRCEIKIVSGSFKNLYQDNEICDLTIA